MEFFTKNGQSIFFDIKDEGIDRRGWIVYVFNALIDEKTVGHMTVSYIPKLEFEQKYLSIWHWLKLVEGYCLKNINDLDQLWLDVNLNSFHAKKVPNEEERDFDLIDWAKRFQSKFDKFKDYHVDKPQVDFVKVEENFRRNGIGLALYQYVAQWLAKEKQLPLYCGLRNEQSEAVWNKMIAMKYLPIKFKNSSYDKLRILLDFREEKL